MEDLSTLWLIVCGSLYTTLFFHSMYSYFIEEKCLLEREGHERKEAHENIMTVMFICCVSTCFSDKSPITPDRFEELGGADAPGLQRPKKKAGTVTRGKAKALYTFNAQNQRYKDTTILMNAFSMLKSIFYHCFLVFLFRELSFRKHDVIYLLRDLDRNWYEGEHHGRVGILPKSYVEVTTSLDEARSAAIRREGLATAKYNFNAQTGVELSMRKVKVNCLLNQLHRNKQFFILKLIY